MQFLKIISKKAVLFLLLALPLLSYAQPKQNSPYSRFGFGDISDDNFIYSQLMGGLGASYRSPYDINTVNPASLGYLDATSFDLGISARKSDLTDNTGLTTSLWSGNLSYISLAFPLQNKLNDLLDRRIRDYSFGMAITLKPYSEVGYNINSRVVLDDVGIVNRNYQGDGGTYDFSWSGGGRYKDFAFGVNLGYLFGRVRNQRFVNFEDLGFSDITLVEDRNQYSGFLYKLGLMYTLNLKKVKASEDSNVTIANRKITFGLHLNSNTNLDITNDNFTGSSITVSGLDFRDTLSSSQTKGLKGKLPAQIGIGATYYGAESLALGVNYVRTSWSQFISSDTRELVKGTLNDSYKLSFGGYLRPNYKSLKYFSRVYYRFGAFYSKLPTNIAANNGTAIEDVGVSIGFGLPFFYQRKISHTNLGVTLGLKGRDTVIEERYFKFTMSFTFNDDEWFIKRKYN